jgi:preprotein translocase subunit SecY
LASFSKATELKRRLWFTLGALVLFRLLSFVPIPGIDPRALASLFQTQQGGVLDFFNTFSGGSLERMSIIALGVMPYITASIVVQLGGSLYEPWKVLKKEGETGRKKLNQYTRYLTVLLTTVQGYFIAVGLEGLAATQGISAVVEPGLLFRAAATISLVGGTLFLMWIGEQITPRCRAIWRSCSRVAARARWTRWSCSGLSSLSSAWSCLSASWNGLSAAS